MRDRCTLILLIPGCYIGGHAIIDAVKVQFVISRDPGTTQPVGSELHPCSRGDPLLSSITDIAKKGIPQGQKEPRVRTDVADRGCARRNGSVRTTPVSIRTPSHPAFDSIRGPWAVLLLAFFTLASAVQTTSLSQTDSTAERSSRQAERNDSSREFICFPKALAPWKFVKTVGFTLAYIPKLISEEEINHSPLLDVNMRLGFPYNFSALARVSTIGITNHFLVGGQWSHSIDTFSFALGFDFAYWFGFFRRPDFDVVASGTMDYPFIAFGFDFDDFFVSIKAEAQIVTFSETFVGDASVGGIERELAGFSVTYSLEQPFWKNTYVMQGVRISYTKFFYQSWISFSTIDRYVLYPEFIIGIQL